MVRGANSSFMQKTLIWQDDVVIYLEPKVILLQLAMEVVHEPMSRRRRLPIPYITLAFLKAQKINHQAKSAY